jgi:hypothetical protein
MARWWVEEGIVGIEDVTERARGLWEFVEGEKERGGENWGLRSVWRGGWCRWRGSTLLVRR